MRVSSNRSSIFSKDLPQDFFPLNCNNPITALAGDSNCRYLVVGGRECFFFRNKIL